LAVLETGVDQNAHLVLLQYTPGEKGGIVISHPGYEIKKQKRI
jgi:hypothetical protein